MTFDELAAGAKFRLYPAGPLWLKVNDEEATREGMTRPIPWWTHCYV